MCWGGKVLEISPITNAENIVQAKIGCGDGGIWLSVVPKETVVGQTMTVYLHDAVLKPSDQYSFLEKRKWRIKSYMLRGAYSECFAIPGDFPVGKDLTEELGVLKYIKDPPKDNNAKGNFPDFIPKTDEPNFQSAYNMIQALMGQEYVATIKYDGTSHTYYRRGDYFGACSRNLEMKRENNLPFLMFQKYNIESILKDKFYDNTAIQCECVGPKIQNNPLKLLDTEIRVFNIFDIVQQKYWDHFHVKAFCEKNKLPMAEVAHHGIFSEKEANSLREMCKIKYASGETAEGLVFRPTEERMVGQRRLSFKVINAEYSK